MDRIVSAAVNMGRYNPTDILQGLDTVLQLAKQEGMSEGGLDRVSSILENNIYTLLINLRDDPPAQVHPYSVELKVGARPHRTTQCRYARAHNDYIEGTIHCHERLGAGERKQTAKWASPELSVLRPVTGKLCFTVNLRGFNMQKVAVSSAMPNREGLFRSAGGSKLFAKSNYVTDTGKYPCTWKLETSCPYRHY